MHQVDRHSEMLYEMDIKMTIMNKTIQQIMWNLDSMHYETNLLHFYQNKLYRIYTSLYALQSDTDSLYEYMRALASQELNPMIIPPDILKNILHKIETETCIRFITFPCCIQFCMCMSNMEIENTYLANRDGWNVYNITYSFGC